MSKRHAAGGASTAHGSFDAETGLPAEFTALLGELFDGADLEVATASFGSEKAIFARVNTLKVDRESALAALAEAGVAAVAVEWMSEGLQVDPSQRDALLAHPLAESGALYAQGASSWLPVMALDPQPGEEVLDLAAAPGGKSLHLAALMQNRGRLACVEPIKPRFYRLKANLERGGVSIARLYKKDGRRVGGAVPDRFDRVLLDAPCSSQAQFRTGVPETWAHWSPRKIKEQARKQRGLILSAWQALKPGGRMVYATCSLSPEEDEAILQHLLERAAGAEILPVDLAPQIPVRPGLTSWRGATFDPRVALSRRVLPGPEFDAFFFAVLHKRG